MRVLPVDIQNSCGRILCSTIFKSDGQKLLARGHLLSDQSVRLLEMEGMREVWVTELEEGEVGEDEVVMAVAQAMCCGCVEIRLAPGGRANLTATEDCCVLVDNELLQEMNATSTATIATAPNYKFVRAGERVATVKSAPFAVAQDQLAAALSFLNERDAILQARPLHRPAIGILYTDPVEGERARRAFEWTLRTRFEQYRSRRVFSFSCVEEEEPLFATLQRLMVQQPSLILIASTTTLVGPEDEVGRAATRLGVQLERFLAPVDPGGLMMLSYKDDLPILSAPGCYRSLKPNILDLILPPLLSKHRMTDRDIARLGLGGLLS
jgi:molybdenum cofactor cytidylyltransferase